jgi:type II secretory pathway component HofQ
MVYRTLLVLLLFPMFAFPFTLVRKDGKVFSGRLVQQSPEGMVIKDSEGVTIKFQAHQIDWNQTTIEIQNQEKPVIVTPAPQPRILREARPVDRWTGEPFTFDFKDIDVKDLFRFIADISGLNVILDPGVRGTVTLKMTDVPWDQALDLITRNQGLGYTIEGNVIRIAPFSKIAQELRARRQAEEERMLSGPLVTRLITLSYAKAEELQGIIRRLLTSKGSVIVDRRTNTLIITDVESNIDNLTGAAAFQ